MLQGRIRFHTRPGIGSGKRCSGKRKLTDMLEVACILPRSTSLFPGSKEVAVLSPKDSLRHSLGDSTSAFLDLQYCGVDLRTMHATLEHNSKLAPT